MKLLVNGKVVSEPLTLPFSLSFIRGDGLFETILGIDEKIIAWQRHYERLVKSAEKLLITIPAKIDIEVGINCRTGRWCIFARVVLVHESPPIE